MSKKQTEKLSIEIGVSEITKRVLSEIQEQKKFTQTLDEEFLTAKQTAEFLKVDISTLWRFEKSGYLVPARIGAKRIYRVDDLKKILQDKNKVNQ